MIHIVSGEGTGGGAVESHTGKLTLRSVIGRLQRERAGGRWAFVRVNGERVEDARIDYVLRSLRKSRSGTKWTEAQYRAAGYHQIKVRLPLDTIEILISAAESAGVSRSEYLDGLIRAGSAKS